MLISETQKLSFIIYNSLRPSHTVCPGKSMMVKPG